ncbi:hypothetical protein QYE76_018506 [Lolium multiflorum]|uniref:BTB domain-containing protein n=1 Tax=Lolium multiflorum TaxID=4521 RepID=A0AAD8UX96_LOLMU|nr:hypothetical protein QYE76_018506 [Lolium multiflorum]
MVDSSFTEFKLDYPEIKSHILGNPVSKSISAGSYNWKVECCYMDGVEDDILDVHFSVYSKFNTFHGFIDVFLLRRGGAPSSCRAKRSLLETGEYNKGSYLTWWGHMYVKQGCLESRYVKNGVTTLICGVIALPANSITVPASNISDHFGSLLGCSDRSDVSFSVGGEMFRAHRAVLAAARSPVFKSELFGSMVEATTPCITLDDIDPAAFKAMLGFIYTDRLCVDWDPETFMPKPQQFEHLLAAADRYDLSRLKLMCAQELWDKVSVEMVATTLGHAEMHSCPELKSRCLDFFMTGKNFKRIVLTEGYMWLMQHFPSVIDETRSRHGLTP